MIGDIAIRRRLLDPHRIKARDRRLPPVRLDRKKLLRRSQACFECEVPVDDKVRIEFQA